MQYVGQAATSLRELQCLELTEALVNSSLNILFLAVDYNKITDLGVSALCCSLKENVSVCVLSLAGNPVSSASLALLLDYTEIGTITDHS